MAGTQSHIDVAAPATVSIDSQPGREFFQERLGIFGFWNSALSLGFVPLRIVGELWLDPQRPISALLTTPSMIAHLGASATAAVVWLLTRRRAWSLRGLHMLDAFGIISVGTLFALMGASLMRGESGVVSDSLAAMLMATLAVVMTMMWRAVTVPSPPRRTGLLTALGVAPLIVADVFALRTSGGAVAAMFVAAWAVLTLVCCTVISAIVYGLRREVQRARRLGQYTLDEKIGEGAMGVVYRASHAMLRRPTAIKLLPPNRAGSVDLKRFEREVQLTAMLTHPNTVAIYDYGRTPDGVFYYAMEFLDGINLEDLVRRYGPQTSGRVIYILRQVCRALSEAHALGLIHRDVKPANVILTVRGGEPDIVKVVDFGLVKWLESAGTALTATLDGGPILAGTPLYFAPEAISAPEQVKAGSDLYSLGAVAYYLVTGQPLFEARTVMELCAHHLHTTPIAPSARLGRRIDPGLEAIIMQCLAKTPSERPASARALEESLAACAAAREWTDEDARRWWADHADAARRTSASPVDPGAETVAVDLALR